MTSIQIYQLLGIVYTVIGVGILLNPRYYRKMLDEFVRSLPVVFLNAFLVLGLGYLFLVADSGNPGGRPLLVSILGWLALLKGIFILIMPKAYLAFAKTVKLHFLTAEAIIAVILGIALLYLGFAA